MNLALTPSWRRWRGEPDRIRHAHCRVAAPSEHLLGPRLAVDTPTLRSLAGRARNVVGARAAVPHTSKALWTMLCGRWPALRPNAAEATSRIDAPCPPRLLDRAGYRTAFFQSAFGTFEERPRRCRTLVSGVRRMGRHRRPTLGYLASDDESLMKPLEQFISAAPDQPFAVVLLTSATHHFYQLSDASDDRAAAANRSRGTRQERMSVWLETARCTTDRTAGPPDTRTLPATHLSSSWAITARVSAIRECSSTTVTTSKRG